MDCLLNHKFLDFFILFFLLAFELFLQVNSFLLNVQKSLYYLLKS